MRDAFAHGDHICVLYDSEDEQMSIAAEYVAEGLKTGRAVPLCGAVRSPPWTGSNRALERAGASAGDVVARRALVQATHADAHLDGGRFDSARMLRMLDETVEDALNDGFTGLRTCSR
jgi:hypothetical protein